MAQINLDTFKQLEKERNIVHSKVSASYTFFTKDGYKYFQIDTYGSNTRKMKEKCSQSFQFDEETARYFVNLLINKFDMKF